MTLHRGDYFTRRTPGDHCRVETNSSLVTSTRNASISNDLIETNFRIVHRKVVVNPIFKIPIGQEVTHKTPKGKANQLRSREVLFVVVFRIPELEGAVLRSSQLMNSLRSRRVEFNVGTTQLKGKRNFVEIENLSRDTETMLVDPHAQNAPFT